MKKIVIALVIIVVAVWGITVNSYFSRKKDLRHASQPFITTA